MTLPSEIAILEALPLLDGGTILLLAITPLGIICEIRLMQRAQRNAANSGRLLFDTSVIPLRSSAETQLISLIRAAIFQPARFFVLETQKYTLYNYSFSGAEINNLLSKPVAENTCRWCQAIISYVESREYVEFVQDKTAQD